MSLHSQGIKKKGGELRMKKIITILLTLGILMAGAGIAGAANLNITANVQSSLTLGLNPTLLEYDSVQPGLPSEAQPLTATTTGGGSYQLTLSSTNFVSAGGTQGASTLQFKEHDASVGSYKGATTNSQNMLTNAGTATLAGDAKVFDMRVNFQSTATNGTYGATVTITAVPQ
jgi:hypothetical protein